MIEALGPYVVDVDVERTRAFYRNADFFDCNCAGCRNFLLAAPELSAPVLEFFGRLGIDVQKPAEIWANYSEDGNATYYGGLYHLCGTLVRGKKPWIRLKKNLFHLRESFLVPLTADFSVSFSEDVELLEEGFPSPVVQLEVHALLPWILKEENPYRI